jgi:hypothetical protein
MAITAGSRELPDVRTSRTGDREGLPTDYGQHLDAIEGGDGDHDAVDFISPGRTPRSDPRFERVVYRWVQAAAKSAGAW